MLNLFWIFRSLSKLSQLEDNVVCLIVNSNNFFVIRIKNSCHQFHVIIFIFCDVLNFFHVLGSAQFHINFFIITYLSIMARTIKLNYHIIFRYVYVWSTKTATYRPSEFHFYITSNLGHGSYYLLVIILQLSRVFWILFIQKISFNNFSFNFFNCTY